MNIGKQIMQNAQGSSIPKSHSKQQDSIDQNKYLYISFKNPYNYKHYSLSYAFDQQTSAKRIATQQSREDNNNLVMLTERKSKEIELNHGPYFSPQNKNKKQIIESLLKNNRNKNKKYKIEKGDISHKIYNQIIKNQSDHNLTKGKSLTNIYQNQSRTQKLHNTNNNNNNNNSNNNNNNNNSNNNNKVQLEELRKLFEKTQELLSKYQQKEKAWQHKEMMYVQKIAILEQKLQKQFQ